MFPIPLCAATTIHEYSGENIDIVIVAQRHDRKAYVFTIDYTLQKIKYHRQHLIAVEIPEGIKEIYANAFRSAVNLKQVNFPSSVVVIGASAFARCVRLKAVELPYGLRVIQKRAFENCFSLESVGLPYGVKVLGKGAFMNCLSLTHIEIPWTIQKVQNYTFLGCTGLQFVELEEGIHSNGRLQAIGKGAFYACRAIQNVKIASTVKHIRDSAFAKCSSLRYLNLPEHLKSLGRPSFRLRPTLRDEVVGCLGACEALVIVQLPKNIKVLECCVFAGCFSLISVELPEGLGEIKNLAFRDCKSLVNIAIPSTVGLVARSAFQNCEKLWERFPGYDEDSMVDALESRFDGLRLHAFCYFHSFFQLERALDVLERYQEDMLLESANTPVEIDRFGMTPFHILSLSTRPNFHLFRALMLQFKVNVLDIFYNMKDVFGCSPLDYLERNPTSMSTQWVDTVTDASKRLKLLGLKRHRTEIADEIYHLFRSWSDYGRNMQIGIIRSKLDNFEKEEIASTLEMAVWKVKLDTQRKNCKERNASSSSVDRLGCWVSCEAEMVVNNVLPFLDSALSPHVLN